MKLLLLLMLGTTTVLGQFSYGLRGGLPFTNFFQAASNPDETFSSNATQFIIGPTAELRLPAGLGVELDALFRHFQYNGSASLTDETTHDSAGNAWEFPLLVKYRIPGEFVRPYLDAGVAFDHWGGTRQTIDTLTALSTSQGTSGSNTGFVLGAGIELHLPLVRLSPEIRYTRWGAASIANLGGALQSNQNQAELLIGLTF